MAKKILNAKKRKMINTIEFQKEKKWLTSCQWKQYLLILLVLKKTRQTF